MLIYPSSSGLPFCGADTVTLIMAFHSFGQHLDTMIEVKGKGENPHPARVERERELFVSF
jgi:hypothetical protein